MLPEQQVSVFMAVDSINCHPFELISIRSSCGSVSVFSGVVQP
ncbi:hypothetical protein [Candidatus Vondammii sp. HM_W22]